MPAVPTLTVTDNADGSGAVATVAGSTVGSTNVVSVQTYDGLTWTAAGTRTGDGTLALALAKGYCFAKCDSSLSGQNVVSNVVRCPVTDANDSVHARAAEYIRSNLATLSLGGAEQNVKRMTLPTEEVMTFPGVIVWFNDGEQIIGGSNNRDDIGYPVHVAIVDQKLTSLSIPPDQYLLYRQRCIRKIRNQPMAGIPEIMTVQVQPSLVVDEKLPAYDYFVTAWTFICVSREVRG